MSAAAADVAAARLPPPGLAGLDPAWSRLVTVAGPDGVAHSWHVLDSDAGPSSGSSDATAETRVTLLCVHGNPTWSYLWRRLLAAAPPGVRVVAVDQLGMGFSERLAAPRPFAQRIDDLGALTDALGVHGPVVTVAHDWGGPISLGWAVRHRDQLAGIVLTNTAVDQPAGTPAPALIRIVRSRGLLELLCVRTSAFVDGTLVLAHPQLPGAVRRAFRAPYGDAARRRAIGDFVRDIPLDLGHASWSDLVRLQADLATVADVPTLVLWGGLDPVFTDVHLADLRRRLPRAQVHRFATAGHLVVEDADVTTPVLDWVGDLGPPAEAPPTAPPAGMADTRARRPLWSGLEQASEEAPDQVAVVELGGDGPPRSRTFAELDADVLDLAAGLVAWGVAPGDRVALLVPPGIDLVTAVYACWRAAATVVVADAGLGPRGIGRALRSADPAHLIGIPRALAAARALRWPGRAILAGARRNGAHRLLGAASTLDELRRSGAGCPPPPAPGPEDDAAVLFTSGATGPAKGVVYRHRQLEAQRDALAAAYAIGPSDRLVAAFAPFALYGPALGIPSVVPDMDVTAPGTLTATALADAVSAVDATLVFASPAALVNVVATGSELDGGQRQALGGVRVLLSAGAPVPASLLRRATALVPGAEAHTPYGMTEALPVADITLAAIEAAGPGNGVCVGRPLPGVQVAVSPLDDLGAAVGALTSDAGTTGEICVAAAHVKDRYDKLWATERTSSRDPGWHHTGDVGHLDDHGRLWVEGRLAHIITTAGGVVTPVGIELRVQQLDGVALAAAVGVGPAGTQQVVLVVATDPPASRPGAASPTLTAAVRTAAALAGGPDVAAVLVRPALPVDLRHASKVDRADVAAWATQVLAGGRAGRR